MCAFKAVALVLVVAVVALGALYYFQSPAGTWIVDREAMQQEGEADLASRLLDGLNLDLMLVMTDDGKFTLWEGKKALFAGTWGFKDGEVQFADFPLDEVVYDRPGSLTTQFLGNTVIFKRQ